MAHVLGVDIDNGDYSRHGRWTYEVTEHPGLIPEGAEIPGNSNVMLTDGKACVLAERCNTPAITVNTFGNGIGIFCTGFRHTPLSPRLLQNLILHSVKETEQPEYITNDALVEATYFPVSNNLALINNSQLARMASCKANGKTHTVEMKPYELLILTL